jgi:predicted DCC family thiol-disulfide oxidoreductase YuxK
MTPIKEPGADEKAKGILPAQLLYDGQCPFCLKSVATLKRLDWLGRLRYLDARDPASYPAVDPPLKPDRLLEEMHLLTPDGKQVFHGFGAFRWLSWRLPLLWLTAPFLYIPGVPAIGGKAYRWIARNRFNLVPCHGGVCAASRERKRPG